MYTRQEASLIRKKFWTCFSLYMQPIRGAEGDTVNWLNYKTGIRHIYFRMDADNTEATIGIELTHTDPLLRLHYFEQFQGMKTVFAEVTGEDWEWQPAQEDEHGYLISRISKTLKEVNIFREADWPAIISFFKPRMIALDNFWRLVKDAVE